MGQADVIVGEVKPSREAVIRLSVRGPESVPLPVDAVVDTGFTDALTLPLETVRYLGLPFRGTMDFGLADGSAEEFDLFVGHVEWDGRWRETVIAAAEGGPLVGMELMHGYHLGIDVIDGGRVVIEALRT